MNKVVICKDVFGNKYKHEIEELKQTIRAYVIVIENNKMLLTKQWNGYSLVGGGVEKGESFEETIIRETKEETGLDIIPGEMFYNTFRFFQRKPETQPVQAFQFYFKHKVISGNINNNFITNSEKLYTNGNAEWIELDKLNDIVFRHSVDLNEILEAYFNSGNYYFQSSTPGKLWIQAMESVYNNGYNIKDGEQNLKELISVLVSIENPLIIDDEIKEYGDISMIEWMKNNFLSTNPIQNWGYSYGQRMYQYNGVYDQFDNILNKLINNPESKSATISFTNPEYDNRHMPCIISLDLKIRNNKIIGNAFFRSQDAGKKFYADIICIGEIMKLFSDKLGIDVGELKIFIASLHIYESDFEKVKRICKIEE